MIYVFVGRCGVGLTNVSTLLHICSCKVDDVLHEEKEWMYVCMYAKDYGETMMCVCVCACACVCARARARACTAGGFIGPIIIVVVVVVIVIIVAPSRHAFDHF